MVKPESSGGVMSTAPFFFSFSFSCCCYCFVFWTHAGTEPLSGCNPLCGCCQRPLHASAYAPVCLRAVITHAHRDTQKYNNCARAHTQHLTPSVTPPPSRCSSHNNEFQISQIHRSFAALSERVNTAALQSE